VATLEAHTTLKGAPLSHWRFTPAGTLGVVGNVEITDGDLR
jgi:hypothetical protein